MKTRRMVEALYDALGYGFEDKIGAASHPVFRRSARARHKGGVTLNSRFDLLLEHLGLEIETIEAGERLVKRAKKGRKA